MKNKCEDIDKIFQRLLDEGIIVIGIIGITRDSDMFTRVMNPEVMADVLKKKENICIDFNDSLIDNSNHLSKSLSIFIEKFCKLTGIPEGRSPKKFKVKKQEVFE